MEPDSVPELEVLLARQHTMLWNEDQCLDIALGQHATPISFIYDSNAGGFPFPMSIGSSILTCV
jgi:hypothetical protein